MAKGTQKQEIAVEEVGVVALMQSLQKHEGWKMIERRIDKEIAEKERYILNNMNDSTPQEKLAKSERIRLIALKNKPKDIILEANPMTYTQMYGSLD
jgi:hypothetical protein